MGYFQIQLLYNHTRHQRFHNLSGSSIFVDMTAQTGGFAALTHLRNVPNDGAARIMTVTTNSRTLYYHCGFHNERRILVQVICRHFGYRMGISKSVCSVNRLIYLFGNQIFRTMKYRIGVFPYIMALITETKFH